MTLDFAFLYFQNILLGLKTAILILAEVELYPDEEKSWPIGLRNLSRSYQIDNNPAEHLLTPRFGIFFIRYSIFRFLRRNDFNTVPHISSGRKWILRQVWGKLHPTTPPERDGRDQKPLARASRYPRLCCRTQCHSQKLPRPPHSAAVCQAPERECWWWRREGGRDISKEGGFEPYRSS